jgi:hypothetical protein
MLQGDAAVIDGSTQVSPIVPSLTIKAKYSASKPANFRQLLPCHHSNHAANPHRLQWMELLTAEKHGQKSRFPDFPTRIALTLLGNRPLLPAKKAGDFRQFGVL